MVPVADMLELVQMKETAFPIAMSAASTMMDIAGTGERVSLPLASARKVMHRPHML